MSDDEKLAQLCAQIDKETDWQKTNQLVDEVVEETGDKKIRGRASYGD